jgi:hypothetical protein
MANDTKRDDLPPIGWFDLDQTLFESPLFRYVTAVPTTTDNSVDENKGGVLPTPKFDKLASRIAGVVSMRKTSLDQPKAHRSRVDRTCAWLTDHGYGQVAKLKFASLLFGRDTTFDDVGHITELLRINEIFPSPVSTEDDDDKEHSENGGSVISDFLAASHAYHEIIELFFDVPSLHFIEALRMRPGVARYARMIMKAQFSPSLSNGRVSPSPPMTTTTTKKEEKEEEADNDTARPIVSTTDIQTLSHAAFAAGMPFMRCTRCSPSSSASTTTTTTPTAGQQRQLMTMRCPLVHACMFEPCTGNDRLKKIVRYLWRFIDRPTRRSLLERLNPCDIFAAPSEFVEPSYFSQLSGFLGHAVHESAHRYTRCYADHGLNCYSGNTAGNASGSFYADQHVSKCEDPRGACWVPGARMMVRLDSLVDALVDDDELCMLKSYGHWSMDMACEESVLAYIGDVRAAVAAADILSGGPSHRARMRRVLGPATEREQYDRLTRILEIGEKSARILGTYISLRGGWFLLRKLVLDRVSAFICSTLVIAIASDRRVNDECSAMFPGWGDNFANDNEDIPFRNNGGGDDDDDEVLVAYETNAKDSDDDDESTKKSGGGGGRHKQFSFVLTAAVERELNVGMSRVLSARRWTGVVDAGLTREFNQTTDLRRLAMDNVRRAASSSSSSTVDDDDDAATAASVALDAKLSALLSKVEAAARETVKNQTYDGDTFSKSIREHSPPPVKPTTTVQAPSDDKHRTVEQWADEWAAYIESSADTESGVGSRDSSGVGQKPKPKTRRGKRRSRHAGGADTSPSSAGSAVETNRAPKRKLPTPPPPSAPHIEQRTPKKSSSEPPPVVVELPSPIETVVVPATKSYEAVGAEIEQLVMNIADDSTRATETAHLVANVLLDLDPNATTGLTDMPKPTACITPQRTSTPMSLEEMVPALTRVCVLCGKAPKTACFLPCRHVYACVDCARHETTCIVCNTAVGERLELLF